MLCIWTSKVSKRCLLITYSLHLLPYSSFSTQQWCLRAFLKIQITFYHLQGLPLALGIRSLPPHPNLGHALLIIHFSPNPRTSFLPGTNTCSCFSAFVLTIPSAWATFSHLFEWCTFLKRPPYANLSKLDTFCSISQVTLCPLILFPS